MTTSSLPTEIQGMLDRFDQALTRIEEKVAPYVEKPRKEVAPALSATENAKLNLVYSYSLNSLFYMYLKTQGVSPKEHPVRREIDRVKRYMGKAMQMEERAKKQEQKQREQADADLTEDAASQAPKTPNAAISARGSKRKTPDPAEQQSGRGSSPRGARDQEAATPRRASKTKSNNNNGAKSSGKKKKTKRKR